jgi:hypothetical protein
MRGPGGEPEVLASTFSIEAAGYGHSFQERRLAGPVLADEEGHGPWQRELPQVPDRRNRERIFLERRNLVTLERDGTEEWGLTLRHLVLGISARVSCYEES